MLSITRLSAAAAKYADLFRTYNHGPWNDRLIVHRQLDVAYVEMMDALNELQDTLLTYRSDDESVSRDS